MPGVCDFDREFVIPCTDGVGSLYDKWRFPEGAQVLSVERDLSQVCDVAQVEEGPVVRCFLCEAE